VIVLVTVAAILGHGGVPEIDSSGGEPTRETDGGATGALQRIVHFTFELLPAHDIYIYTHIYVYTYTCMYR